MSVISKLVKEKTTDGIFDDIKYETLRKISCVLVTLFMLNPALQLASLLYFDVSLYNYMHRYNDYVLFFGVCIFVIVLKKLADEKRLKDVKGFIKSNIPVVALLVYGILMIVTTIINGAPKIAISGSFYRGEGLLGYLSYIVYFLLTAFVLTPRQKQKATYLLAGSSLFVAVVIYIDFMVLGEKHQYANGNSLIFSQYNHLGYYMLISIMNFGMLFITKRKLVDRLACLTGFVLMLLALIMNDTWGCQIALFVGLIFIIISYSIAKSKFCKVTVVLVIATICTYVGAYGSDVRLRENIDNNIVQQIHDTMALVDKDNIEEGTTGVARIFLWENAFKLLCESPITGHGADVTGDRLYEMTNDNDRCHCEYLNYAVSYGVPAALLYIVAIFMMYLRGLKKKKKLTDINLLGLSVALAYLASAMIGNSMFYTAPYLFIMLGLGYVREDEEKIKD